VQEIALRYRYAVCRPARVIDPNPLLNNFTLMHQVIGATLGSIYDGKEIASVLHFDGGNLLFCDGHVKWRKTTDLKASDFGLTTGPAATVGQPGDTWSSDQNNKYSAAF
jgi:prepilin-type processing-associated H-X9-DG protein